ncbi:uncharacterized protein LOC114528942 [Dendronephthya gigantea]|uniref:uncharacterized protein LOC114528942 n=1 Tax=Dendronephthya gigantea TaxID=151771 RepID=UPI001069EAC8|nr:uncharacterized protein LOC114528942 [Dendronephthya gigantea]
MIKPRPFTTTFILLLLKTANINANSCSPKNYDVVREGGSSLPSGEIISRHNVTSSVVMLECHTHCKDDEKCVGFNYRTTKNVENCQLTNVTNNRGDSNKRDWILPWDAEEIESVKLFCDMKADGGGWTLVSNLVLNQPRGMDWSLGNDYQQISEYETRKLALSTYVLHVLRSKMSFNQLRFFCHKKNPGRVFDIATNKTNNLGQEVIKYFTAQTNTLPKSYGSYYRLPDDNSMLASQCSQWGREWGKFKVNKWHHSGYHVQDRLFDHTAFVPAKFYWLIEKSGGRWECDDFKYPASKNDFWKIFVR